MAPGDRRQRWRWPRHWRVALCLTAAALAAAVINLPAERGDYVATRLLLDAMPHPPFHLPTLAAGGPVTGTIRFGGTTATTTASLWVPGRGSRLPGVIVVPGAAPLGRHDPQLVRLARALAGAGRAVLVPDLALRTNALDAADLQRITAAFQALTALPRVDPRRVGLLGISWGGALAVVAAASPPVAATVAFVATFGAFYDLADLVGAVLAGASVYRGRIIPWQTVPGATALVRAAMLSLLPAAQARAVRSALADASSNASAPPRLTPAERAVVALLTNRDPARVARLAADLPAPIQRVRRAFSPAFHLQGLRAPLLALHSTDDPAAPWTESALLVATARVHDPSGARLTLVHVFSHVTQKRSLLAPGSLPDDWRLVRYVAGLLHAHQ
jgi:dienelactone hydrolase